MFRYAINPDAETPIYRQLADQINAQIRSGALKTGTQLPTVRDMAEQLKLSCGTIKHVYDCLQEMGVIEMTRRRGTFVKYVRPDADSRKQQAMHAIDAMVRRLTELQFSPAEIQIFLNLKMREWGLNWSGVRITLVTGCAELTPALENQFSRLANVRVTVCSMDQLQAFPYSMDEQSDLILASAEDAQRVASLIPDSDKLLRIAFASTPASLLGLASMAGRRAGVLCQSDSFAAMVRACLQEPDGAAFVRISPDQDFSHLDGLILPEGHASQYSPELQTKIAVFRAGKPVVEFCCRLDDGSMLSLEEKISNLRNERQLWPGVLRL